MKTITPFSTVTEVSQFVRQAVKVDLMTRQGTYDSGLLPPGRSVASGKVPNSFPDLMRDVQRKQRGRSMDVSNGPPGK